MEYKICFNVIVLLFCGGQIESTQNDTNSEFSAILLHMGERTNDPLIKLLGKAFLSLEDKFESVENLIREANIEKQLKETNRIETSLTQNINKTEEKLGTLLTDKFESLQKEICSMYTCSIWSKWTPCDAATEGEYGLKNRTRQCGRRATFCSESNEITEEMQSRLCQAICPPDYNLTLSRYCVKLYQSKTSRENAEKHCHGDGGHLINIDSYSKSEEIKEILKNGYSDRVWIDGIQRHRGGKWEFSNGSMNSEFTDWHYDQPNGASFPNCMYLLPSDWDWADYACYNTYSFLCEIVSI